MKKFYHKKEVLSDFFASLFIIVLLSYGIMATEFWVEDSGWNSWFGFLFVFIGLAIGVFLVSLFLFKYLTKKKNPPYLIVDKEGLKIPDGDEYLWDDINQLNLGGFSSGSLREDCRFPKLSLTLKGPPANTGGDLTGKHLKANNEKIIHIDAHHLRDRSLIRAIREFAPKNVKIYTPIGY